jgi:isopentenyl phosphate kinase
LSTEKVLQVCLQTVRPQFDQITVIYILGAMGVLDARGQTIPVLANDTTIAAHSTLDHDVTGGITGKVEAARAAAAVADNVYLIDDAPMSLQAVLNGRQAGTRVLP